MWIAILDLLVTIGLVSADHRTAKRIERINAENKAKGIKKKFILLPSGIFALIFISAILVFRGQ
jgi:uncharacterized membrane protein YvbJ